MSAAPPKPWERAPIQSGSASPMGPSTPLDGLCKPWEAAEASSAPYQDGTSSQNAPPHDGNLSTNGEVGVSRPARPWDLHSGLASTSGQYLGTPGYQSGSFYGAGAGYGGYSGPGSSIGGVGYGAPYGGSTWQSMPGPGMYGGGGYYGGSAPGGWGWGMQGGGAWGGQHPPHMSGAGVGPGAGPPRSWQALLQTLGGVVHFLGRLSFLVDENARAVHFFVSALLQLLDRAGFLYGELARFVLRLLGYRRGRKAAAAAAEASQKRQGAAAAAAGAGRAGTAGPQAASLESLWAAGAKRTASPGTEVRVPQGNARVAGWR